jgi:hypothetical protein
LARRLFGFTGNNSSQPSHENKGEYAMQSPNTDLMQRPYEAPAIVHEASLEVRAGTPVGLPDALNLTDQAD